MNEQTVHECQKCSIQDIIIMLFTDILYLGFIFLNYYYQKVLDVHAICFTRSKYVWMFGIKDFL